MSFTDIVPGILVIGFVIILVWSINDYVWKESIPALNTTGTASTINTLDMGWDQNINFINGSFMAIMVIIGIISIILTVYLQSHPVILVLWLFINIIGMFIYDGLAGYLTIFSASSINTGAMADAISFFIGGMPKLLIFLNMGMAVVMLGKRWYQG